MLLVVCYGLSPIDLIPDFVPILGYIDDLIILPILVRIVGVLIPRTIMLKAKTHAFSHIKKKKPKPKVWAGVLIMTSIWTYALILLAHLLVPTMQEFSSPHH